MKGIVVLGLCALLFAAGGAMVPSAAATTCVDESTDGKYADVRATACTGGGCPSVSSDGFLYVSLNCKTP